MYLNNVEPITHLFKVLQATEQTEDVGDPAVATGQNRWLYVVQPCTVQVLETDKPVIQVVSTAPFLNAWNMYEVPNTHTTVMGITVANLPGNFTLQPIETGAVVPGSYTQGEERNMVFLWYPNQWDGTC